MPLSATLNTETHAALPTELQAHYSPNAENAEQFVLQVETADGLELVNATNLRTALQKERGSVATLRGQLKSFDGITDPTAALAAMQKIEELGDKINNLDDETLKKELQSHKDTLTAKFETDKRQLSAKHQTELGKLTENNKILNNQLTDNLVTSAATKAIADEKGSVDLLLPLVKSMMKMKALDDGRLVVVIVDKDGNERISPKSGSTDPMKVDELVAEMKTNTKFGRAFDGTQSSGSGASSATGATGSSGGSYSISAADAKDPAKYRMARETANKAGKQLQIQEA